MGSDQGSLFYSPVQATMKFESARREAFFERILALLTRRSSELLSYHDVRQLVSARSQRDEGTQMIALGRIVGSEGRYQDFTRTFLPLEGASRLRWTKLDRAMNALEDIPPIEVYQIGDIYFVRDGHHRVSVARANGLAEIEAHVVRLESPVELGVDTTPQELLLRIDAERFYEATGLRTVRPDADVRLTEPGLYRQLREHIDVHRYYMGLEQKREIPYAEAVASWYDNVYSPVVAAIREEGVLEGFPNRTEADMYLWVTRRREQLRECYLPGMDAEEAAVEASAMALEEASGSRVQRLWRRVVDQVTCLFQPSEPRS